MELTNLHEFLYDSLDGVRHALGVLLDGVLDPLLPEVLGRIFLEGEADLGTVAGRWVNGVRGDSEGTASKRLPDVLFVIIVF